MNRQVIFEVVYIRATAAAVWAALTDPEITRRYWYDTRIESDWRVGSPIRYVRHGEVTDEHEVLAVAEPHRLSHTFHPLHEAFQAESPSRVTFTLEADSGVVRLTVRHDGFPPDSGVYRACSDGWPMILSNLKTLLETGEPLPACAFGPQADRFE